MERMFHHAWSKQQTAPMYGVNNKNKKMGSAYGVVEPNEGR